VSVAGDSCIVAIEDFDNQTLISSLPSQGGPGDACKVVIRTSEIRLSHEPFPDGMPNVIEAQMISREFRGGLTDHRLLIGARELVVTSHKLCPMVQVNGEGGKTFLSIDKSAISLIVI
jgi:hypothetical protein